MKTCIEKVEQSRRTPMEETSISGIRCYFYVLLSFLIDSAELESAPTKCQKERRIHSVKAVFLGSQSRFIDAAFSLLERKEEFIIL